ncbi:MFS transporter [Ignicoccus hospitalis]|uniref:Major facilitator superfamily MFS_1 n=1 Tax=Ignicoccus hospitalis (strain KIN4/I / DSM 18386 / JCM 14125) TaxID=453591 RepID=A8AB85_IGNH4|nr:MFS transporter [Ignicoccus hospitalis]ABU82187.1 major facilitator superfamily MFS_1 [Ignicoccus hospitalis KIN4/I]HIH91145.1 MFS transporter [Desulfurococcaceae archaeon]
MEVLEELHRLALVLALPGVALLILLPLYIREMHGSSELIGLAASVGPLTFAALRLVGGVATDVFGRKSTFVFGIAVYSLGLLIMALAPNADVVALGGSMCGTGAMVAMTSAIVIVADVAPTPEAYGKLSSSLALGGTLGSVIPLTLINYFGLLGFRLSFFIYFLASVYALYLAKRLPETKPKETKVEFEWSWRWVLATAIGSLVAFSSGAVTPFFPVFIREQFGLSPVGVMIAYAPSAVAAIVSPRLAGRASPEAAAFAFDSLGSFGSLLITWRDPALSSLGFSFVTGAVGGSSVAQDAMVASSCKRSCGFMVGLYNSITQIFTGLASLWAGSVYSSCPQKVFFTASATFAAAATIALVAILKGRVGRNVWTGE